MIIKKSNNRSCKKTTEGLRTVIILIILSMILGTILGFIIGRKSASTYKQEPEVEIIETAENILLTKEEIPSEQTTKASLSKLYYDCPLSEDLQDYIRGLCEEKKIPMDLVIAKIEVESSYNAGAISPTNDYGLMQINKTNHKRFIDEYGITDFLDPYQNVFCGITLLSEAYSRVGDLDKALMVYNLGKTGAMEFWERGIYSTPYTKKIRNAMAELKMVEV